MGSSTKTYRALIPVTGLVLGAHAVVLLGLPSLSGPVPPAPAPVVMETRMVEPAAPPPPPSAPAPPPAPALAPRPRPRPVAAPAPAKPAQPAAAAADEPIENPAHPLEESAPPAPESEAAASSPAPSPAPAPELPADTPEANGADTARPLQVRPGGGEPLPPGTLLPVALPGSATLEFNASGQVKGFHYSAGAQLQWQQDGQYYQARQSISMFLMGERSQTSDGLITPQGLQPLNFTDKGRKTQSAHFDVAGGKSHYSDGTADAAISDGIQDRLSVFLQLSALIAGAPERYPPGTLIELTSSSARAAARWQFRVGATEALELPVGSIMALRLDKLPGKSGDQRGSVWLAASMQYLPVRIRLAQGNDDFVDLQLKKYLAAPQ